MFRYCTNERCISWDVMRGASQTHCPICGGPTMLLTLDPLEALWYSGDERLHCGCCLGDITDLGWLARVFHFPRCHQEHGDRSKKTARMGVDALERAQLALPLGAGIEGDGGGS